MRHRFPCTEPCRVLFVGHAGIRTGFARVIHSLLRELPGWLELHHLGINFSPESFLPKCEGWTIHSNPGGLHSATALTSVIARVRPAIVVVVDEPWVCVRLDSAFPPGRTFRTVFYGAIDGEASVGPHVAAAVARLDCFVSFTHFGDGIVQRALNHLPPGAQPRLEIIPHGVDSELFHPIAGDFATSRIEARERLGGDGNDLGDAFIVLNANRNQPFKRIDLFLRGFARFARNKPPDVKVWLHMGSRPAEPGEISLADSLGIRERIVSPPYSRHPDVSSPELNLIYNACDVGVNTSVKEGWGLVAFEHAATGAAQIVPRHTAYGELWPEGTALHIDHGDDGATEASVARALERLYRDQDLRRSVAGAGFNNATRTDYSWKSIALRWAELFRELIQTAVPPASSE